MNSFNKFLTIIFLTATGISSADSLKQDHDQVLNIYGSAGSLSEILRKMDSRTDQLGRIKDWKLFSGRSLDKAELAKFCPTCSEVDPLPTPVPVNPCKNNITISKPSAYSYRIKGTPYALAGLVSAASGDKEIEIQEKIILQMVGIDTPSAISSLKILCKDCLEVDPLPTPIPVGGDPCK